MDALGTEIAGTSSRRAEAPPKEAFLEAFERCFHRVYVYVSRRVKERESVERIVSQILTDNVEILDSPDRR